MADFRVRGDHVRSLLRMFAEAQELAGDRAAQQAHLLDGLAELTGAAAFGELYLIPSREGFRVTSSIDRGWATESDLARLQRFYGERGVTANPFAAGILERYDPGAEMVYRREDLVDDRAWYRCDYYAEVSNPTRLDHAMYSLRPGDAPGDIYALGLLRPAGDAPFDDELRGVVSLFHREIFALLRRPAPRELDASREALTSREHDVLEMLLKGLSDKEIAVDLGLSKYTVYQYTRSIYRKLGVPGRARLIALHGRGATRLP